MQRIVRLLMHTFYRCRSGSGDVLVTDLLEWASQCQWPQ